MITKKEFNEMSFDDAFQYCYECYERENKFYYRKGLIECAIKCINYGNFGTALSIVQALNEYPTTDYWYYLFDNDESPIPINCKDELLQYIDIEEGKQKYLVRFIGHQIIEVDVDSSMSEEDIKEKVLEQVCNYAEDITCIANERTNDTLWEEL